MSELFAIFVAFSLIVIVANICALLYGKASSFFEAWHRTMERVVELQTASRELREIAYETKYAVKRIEEAVRPKQEVQS